MDYHHEDSFDANSLIYAKSKKIVLKFMKI